MSEFRTYYCVILYGPGCKKNLSSDVAYNKGADQPAHLRGLISAFVIRSLESITSKLATSVISIFQPVTVAKETDFSPPLSENSKTVFFTMRII